ncbi:PqqD family protein [Streptomyces sp. NPDC051909]|uniref:PqqD family protein n=1 Tax=Streptomyces sp. NPDC051909 TaxID=3154944 RepID=UPI0034332D16
MSAAPSLGPLDVPRRSLGIRIRRVEDGLMIGFRDQALLLSGPAELIYRSVDGRRTVAEVAAVIALEYGIDQAEAVTDVTEFVVDLADNGVFAW